MTRTTSRRPRWGRARLGLIGLLLTLMVAARDASVRSGGAGAWQVGAPVPIAVNSGRARFVVPTPSPGARTLVIVSALSRAAGPYSVRLAARGVARDQAGATPTEPEGPPKARALKTPPLPPAPAPVATMPPTRRTFHLLARDGDVASASNYVAVEGRLRAVGRRVQVYVDAADVGSVGDDMLKDLMATFDDQVFPVAAREFGQARDVDGDGRFTVLMSGWLARLAGGRHAVDGFVRGADLDPALAAPFSNHCDMMYLSTALKAGPHLRTVVAHEYTHAVTASVKWAHGHGDAASRVDEEGWLDEAIAHLVEDRHGFSRSNLDYRVSAFLSQPERYRLVVDDYYAADLFRSHGNRGGTYLFLRWCADRYGPGLVPALIHSGRQGVANLEAATGARFADLFRAWSVTLFFAGLHPSAPSPPAEGPWGVAGPRTFFVDPGGPEVAWSLAGTASRYLIVGPNPGAAVEVTISAPAEADLQVTAVPLPDDLAEIEMHVRAVDLRGGEPCLRVVLRARNGTPVELSALAWEPLSPGPDPHAPGFRHAALDAQGIADAFGASTLPGNGRLSSRPIPARGGLDAPGRPLVVRAIGVDARGRRVAGWAEVREGEAGEEE